MRPLVLTVQVEKNAQAYLENLRKQHFPPEVNYISARLSVFHALPRTMIEQVDSVLTTRTAQHRLIESQVTGVKSLGRGVAFVIPCGELEAPAGRTSGGVKRRSDAGGSEQVETSRHDPEQGDGEAAKALLDMLALKFEPGISLFGGSTCGTTMVVRGSLPGRISSLVPKIESFGLFVTSGRRSRPKIAPRFMGHRSVSFALLYFTILMKRDRVGGAGRTAIGPVSDSFVKEL